MKSLEHPIKLDEPQVSVVENETQRILRDALGRLGPNGEHWAKGDGTVWGEPKCDGVYCAESALFKGAGASHFGRANECLQKAAVGLGYPQAFALNDAAKTTFADVEALYLRAIELAGTHAPQGAA